MLEKIFKKNTTLLYISTSIILLTILICILSQVYTKKLVDTDIEYIDKAFIANSEKTKAKISDVENIIYLNENYYMILTEKQVYVARLSLNEAKNIREKLKNNKNATIYGEIKKVNNDAKNYFVTTYNRISDGKTISKDEYEKKMGKYYLEQKEVSDKKENINNTTIIVSMILVSLGISLSIIFIKNNNKNYNLLKKLSKTEISKINKELSSAIKSHKTYITENYILNYSMGTSLIKYDNILFAYKNNLKNKNRDIIVIYTNDLEKMVVNIESNIKLLDKIKLKNEKVLLGKTDKNLEKLAKEYNGKFNSKYGICFYDPEDGENFLNNYLLINYKKLLKENVIDNCTEEVENLLEKFDQKKFDKENGFVNDDFESDFEDGSGFIEDMPF